MDNSEIIQKILNSDKKKLEWQFSDCGEYVELLYWYEDDEFISNTFISAETTLFTKETSYLHDTYWNDGLQQDIRNVNVNICDEDIEFDIDDIIECFGEISRKSLNKITIQKIED